MNRIIGLKAMIVILSLFLVACSNSENASRGESKRQETKNIESKPITKSAETEETAKAEETEVTTDENNSLESVDLAEGTANVLRYYGTDESYKTINEEAGGSIPISFDGFNVDIIPFLVDFFPNDEFAHEYDNKISARAILVFTKAENTNDFDVDYNGGMTIVTDTKEQVSAEMGLMSSNPIVQTYYGQVEKAGYYIIPLKDDSRPDKITIIMDGPWKVTEAGVDTEAGQMGERQKIELKAFDE